MLETIQKVPQEQPLPLASRLAYYFALYSTEHAVQYYLLAKAKQEFSLLNMSVSFIWLVSKKKKTLR